MSEARADLVVTGARRLVTCTDDALGVIENGAVAARDGRVIWCGPARDLDGAVTVAPDATRIDADGRVVLPGFVDCHTHLVFAGDRTEEFAARARGAPYAAGGVMRTVTATRASSDAELTHHARARLDTFLSFGVTTVEAKSGYGLTPEHEDRLLTIAATLDHPVRVVPTYLGAHVVPAEHAGDPDVYIAQVCAHIERLDRTIPFVDVWCDEGAFTLEQTKAILSTARAAGFSVKVHAEQLSHTGAARLAAELGATSADHLEHVTPADADAMARAGTVAVLLPGASLMTGAPDAPARMLIERGVRVALSTDFNPGTSPTQNLPLMAALACARLGLSVEEAILGITRNAAAAVELDNDAGVIAPGARADLIVLDAEQEAELVYRYGVNLVHQVIARGRI